MSIKTTAILLVLCPGLAWSTPDDAAAAEVSVLDQIQGIDPLIKLQAAQASASYVAERCASTYPELQQGIRAKLAGWEYSKYKVETFINGKRVDGIDYAADLRRTFSTMFVAPEEFRDLCSNIENFLGIFPQASGVPEGYLEYLDTLVNADKSAPVKPASPPAR